MDSFLEDLKQSLDSAVEGLSLEQMSWHPAEKWSVSEILEHLYLTYTGTIKGFERVLDADRPLVSSASMKLRFRKVVVLRFNYLPEGRKAPKTTVPRGLPPEKVKAEVGVKIAEMDEIIARCEARFGGKLLDHPILGPLTATQWRKFHWMHGRLHVRQIERLGSQVRSGRT